MLNEEMRGISFKGTEGKFFKTNDGVVEVLQFITPYNIVVRFLDTGYITSVRSGHLRDGVLKDKMKPSLYGVGILGDGISRKNGKLTKEYSIWSGMSGRCYNENNRSKAQSYFDCDVSEKFKFFPFFSDWCKKQKGFENDGWHLDKDIIVKGNKIYSEDVCCFVPNEINVLIVNSKKTRGDLPIGVNFQKHTGRYAAEVWKFNKKEYVGAYDSPLEAFHSYKKVKEEHIKVIANKWKDQIDVRVYESLMNWEVCIDD